MRLDHLLSKEHSPTLLGWSELAPGSCPNVVRRVAHWVEHYRVGLTWIFRGRLRAGLLWGVVSGTKHTVGCLRQHHRALAGVWLFLMALILDMSAGFSGGCGWGWCVLFENCTVDASIFNCL